VALAAKLQKDAKDTAARKEPVLLYVAGLDKPEEAARLLTDDLDEHTRRYVPLAARKLDDLDEAICQELGDWYYRTLSRHASLVDKPVLLRRAQEYDRRFLELHTKKDAQSYRANAALQSIAGELDGLAASASGGILTLKLGEGVTMKRARIPAGTFVMGSPETEKDRNKDEGPQHRVAISESFYMAATEVTQAQYEAVTGEDPSNWKGPQNPVEQVSWKDATAFCAALSKETGRTIRLPTEAAWECACRARSRGRYSFGNRERDFGAHAWYIDNSDMKTHPVGQKRPNAWGVYDMHGNVWEWCADWYADWYGDLRANARTVDPKGPPTGKWRVLRGGSCHHAPHYCRAAYRQQCVPDTRRNIVGFRDVLLCASGAD
jgi:formylglycine-generating enzyme required for sulfatase activity